MPFGGLLSLAGPALSIAGGIGGLFGGGTPAQNVQGYNYMNKPGADMGALGGTGQIAQLGNQGVYAAQNIQNNPFIQSYLQNAQQTGGQGMQSGQSLVGAGLSELPNVQALMSLGFDPQNALYSKLQNQNQQQNAAILGQSGVASTPYGAGVQADANSNFNINWQNQQLQRAVQASQGASGLLGQIGSTTGTGLQQMQAGGQLPYSAFTGINTDALGALGQAGGISNTAVNDYLAYLSGGTQQQGANLNQANSAFGQQQQLGQGLGQGLAGLSKNWGNVGWGGGGNNWGQNNPGVAGSSYYGPVAPS